MTGPSDNTRFVGDFAVSGYSLGAGRPGANQLLADAATGAVLSQVTLSVVQPSTSGPGTTIETVTLQQAKVVEVQESGGTAALAFDDGSLQISTPGGFSISDGRATAPVPDSSFAASPSVTLPDMAPAGRAPASGAAQRDVSQDRRFRHSVA